MLAPKVLPQSWGSRDRRPLRIGASAPGPRGAVSSIHLNNVYCVIDGVAVRLAWLQHRHSACQGCGARSPEEKRLRRKPLGETPVAALLYTLLEAAVSSSQYPPAVL